MCNVIRIVFDVTTLREWMFPPSAIEMFIIFRLFRLFWYSCESNKRIPNRWIYWCCVYSRTYLSIDTRICIVYMALITAGVLCARSQDSVRVGRWIDYLEIGITHIAEENEDCDSPIFPKKKKNQRLRHLLQRVKRNKIHNQGFQHKLTAKKPFQHFRYK